MDYPERVLLAAVYEARLTSAERNEFSEFLNKTSEWKELQDIDDHLAAIQMKAFAPDAKKEEIEQEILLWRTKRHECKDNLFHLVKKWHADFLKKKEEENLIPQP